MQTLTEHIQKVEHQTSILEMNSSKLLHRIEELTKILSEKDDEIGRINIQLNDKAAAFKKRIMEKQTELDNARTHSEVLEKELHKLKMQIGECLTEQEKVSDHSEQRKLPDYPSNDGPFMLSVPSHAIQVELADALAKYEQSMRQISILEEKISTMEAESQCLCSLRTELQISGDSILEIKAHKKELQALRLRYENLLEAHGEKIERVEELELDLADLKKLLKDQMEYFLEKS